MVLVLQMLSTGGKLLDSEHTPEDGGSPWAKLTSERASKCYRPGDSSLRALSAIGNKQQIKQQINPGFCSFLEIPEEKDKVNVYLNA